MVNWVGIPENINRNDLSTDKWYKKWDKNSTFQQNVQYANLDGF